MQDKRSAADPCRRRPQPARAGRPDSAGPDDLVDRLPKRFAALDACGIPDTLVHGDFHPGNVRGTPGNYRILDWGDCGIGNPMLDLRPSFEYFTPADQLDAIEIWASEWSRVAPGSDGRRAAELARPLGPLDGTVVYQKFLDNIETSERPYHEGDPAHALSIAVAMALMARNTERSWRPSRLVTGKWLTLIDLSGSHRAFVDGRQPRCKHARGSSPAARSAR